MRPEVLRISEKIVIPRRPGFTSFVAYECEHLDDLYNEFTRSRCRRAGSIVMWCGDESRVVPGDMFRTFDYVVCSLIPQRYWDPDGKVRPRKHRELPDLLSRRAELMFFGGFEAN